MLAPDCRPASGVVRYNDVGLRDVSLYTSTVAETMLDSLPVLFEGTLEENISLHRPNVTFDDLGWALRFVELEDEVDALPQGFETPVQPNGANFTRSQILRRSCWPAPSSRDRSC
ncbi:MAG: hypothetical protein U0361_20270 [Nitrospiraceae bacterium]